MQSTNEGAEKLNGLLRGELSAMHIYRQALDKIKDPAIRDELKEVRQCHSNRVEKLTKVISALGIVPAEHPGLAGELPSLLEGGAKLFGDKEAISVLEDQEKKELDEYRKLLATSDPTLSPVVRELLSSQEGTQMKMSTLKSRLQ